MNFTHTGTHYVWLYARGDTSADNSLHAGLDGAETTTASGIDIPAGTGWIWTTDRGSGLVATLEIVTPGVHTINVWMREDGAYIDKLLLTTNAAYVPTGLEPESPRSGITGLLQDDFNDGNMVGWTIVDDCNYGTSRWSVLNNALQQSGDCRGYSVDGAELGSIALNNMLLPANLDIKVRIRVLDPATDNTTVNDGTIWLFNTIGLVFGYQDSDNYYRVDLDGSKGHRKLWRKQAGLYTELNVSPQSYIREQWHDLRVVMQNGVILVFINGQQVLAVENAVFSGGKIGLFCALNSACSFDDLVVSDAPIEPMLGMNLPDGSSPDHASSEYFVETGSTLDVSAFSTDFTGIGGVEFVLDEGLTDEISQTDFLPPYNAQFTMLTTGDHHVTSYLLSASGVRLNTPEATVSLEQIGVLGIHLLTLGDSITNGMKDDVILDDISSDGRNTGGGYAPILNDHLTTSNGVSVTVRNEGNDGEESFEGAARVNAVLSRNPESQAYLVIFGANDSGGTLPTPSGLGLSSGEAGYDGTFKDSIQQIIDAVVTTGKEIFLIKTSPYLDNPSRNALVMLYNQVIDELVAENGFNYVPADLHNYFTAHPEEFDADGTHPNGTGYASVARLVCQQLNGQMGLSCIP